MDSIIIWDHFVQCGTILEQSGPIGFIWNNLGPLEIIWDHFRPFGIIYDYFGTIKVHFGPIRNIQDCMENLSLLIISLGKYKKRFKYHCLKAQHRGLADWWLVICHSRSEGQVSETFFLQVSFQRMCFGGFYTHCHVWLLERGQTLKLWSTIYG